MDSKPLEDAFPLDQLGGALALDFVNTVSGRGGAECVEHFNALDDVVRWATKAGLAVAPPMAPPSLESVRALRETLHQVFAALAAGHTPPGDALARLSQAAAQVRRHGRLEPLPDGHVQWRFAPDAEAMAAVLGPVLLSAEAIIAGIDLSRLRACPRPDCGWLFHDTSKNGSRRWCDMAVCGNRAKARRFRSRARFVAEDMGKA